MKIYIIILLFISCFENSLFQIIKNENLIDFDNFIDLILNFILTSSDGLNETLKAGCIDPNSTDKHYDLIKYSGKDLGEIGYEKGCMEIKDKKATPLLIYFNYQTNDSLYYEKEVLDFLDITTYYIGICVLEKCINFLENELLNYKKNEKLFENLGKIYDANMTGNVKLYYPAKFEENSHSIMINIIIIISLFFLLFKIICALIRIVFFSTFNVHNAPQIEISAIRKIDNLNDSEDEDNQLYLFTSSQSKKNTIPLEDKISSYLDETNRPSYYKFINSFEIINDFNLLFTAKNKYYSEEGIEIFATMRFFIMISELLKMNISSSRLILGKDYFNQNFYRSLLFSFAKISNYSTNCWMILDSAVMGFKFLSYLKKQMHTKNFNYPTISMFLWFFLRTIPKMFLYLIVFFVYTYNSQYLKPFIGSSNFYDFIVEYYFNTKTCFKESNFLLMFNPLSFFDEKQRYSECFKFTYFTMNQFYSFLLFLFIMYLVFRVRQKLLDYFILIAIIINSGLSKYSCVVPSEKYGHYVERFHQGATQNLKKIYLFFNIYFLGVFLGFCFFYYSDTISNKPLYLAMDYTPFDFCLVLIGFLDKLSLLIKYIIIAIILLLLCMFAMYFSILVKKEDTLLVDFSDFLKFLYVYENYFISILFALLCIMLLVIPKENFLGRFFKSNFFNFLNRTSSACFYLFHTIFYFTIALSSLSLKVTYLNVFLQSSGLFMLIAIFSILFTSIYELLIRIAVKKIDWHFNNKKYVQEEGQGQKLLILNK